MTVTKLQRKVNLKASSNIVLVPQHWRREYSQGKRGREKLAGKLPDFIKQIVRLCERLGRNPTPDDGVSDIERTEYFRELDIREWKTVRMPPLLHHQLKQEQKWKFDFLPQANTFEEEPRR
ncbi:hypothetical protein TNCV_4025441 [Trichonephila clavipes]|nr:hypothetical protein TNCV_4025441 [Trichonephila clavipes]